MLAKQNDPISIKWKINITPINSTELNKLAEDFRKHFVPRKELYAEQAFWLSLFNPISEQSVIQTTPVKTEAPRELLKVSLVKTSFQKLKNHLASFDKVVKVRTTPDAIIEGSWGFKHTKAVFKQEVIPFIKTLRDLFKDFDNGLYNELNEDFFNINEWKMKLNAKDVSIANLRKHIKSLKGKNVVEKDLSPNKAHVCFLEFVNDVKKPIGQTFTIVENSCPLTRITSTKVEPLKETTLKSVTTPNTEIKLYRRKTKVAKLVDLSCETSILGSRYDVILTHLSLVKSLKDKVLVMASKVVTSKLQFYYCLSQTRTGPWATQINVSEISFMFSLRSWEKKETHPQTQSRRLHSRKALSATHGPLRANEDSKTDNDIEFINQTLRAYYEEVGISHQTSVERSSQPNDVVERQNQTLVEAAQTMLIFSKAPKPELSHFHVFDALCYPNNDSEELGKLKPKADIGIFVGYAPAKKAYRIYNKRNRLIIETIHVDFDKLTAMAFEQFSSGPGPQFMTPGTLSSGLVPHPPSPTSYVLPTKKD
ncbi:retrovirus-related pol polyprotein from transposon TNT 1-94 [Tanacetum coccineum]